MKTKIPFGKTPESKPIKPRLLPCFSEATRAMRLEITAFIQQYPKVAPVFAGSNKFYKIGAKYFGPEDLLQIAFCAWLKVYHPDVEVLHPKNEGKETRLGQAKKKLMGVRAGASDLLIQAPGLPDLWLELKRKPNKPTKDQLAFLEIQSKMGKSTAVAYDLWEAVRVFCEWKCF